VRPRAVKAVQAAAKQGYIPRTVTQPGLISIIAPMLNEAGPIERFVPDVAPRTTPVASR
jgi:hypothetical protein